MNEYKNRISILRNILQKSNDRDLIDYVFQKILPEIFDFYMENYINPNIIILITAINYITLIYTMNYLQIIN